MTENNLEYDTYCILTHSDITGPAQNFYKYLKRQDVEEILLIEHHFAKRPDRKTVVTRYKNGTETKKETRDFSFAPNPLVRFKDFVCSYLYSAGETYDVVVGVGGFNAISALLLKWTGRADSAIFWTIDYVPNRFDNELLNRIYHTIDKVSVKYCDETWNLGARMETAREEHNGMTAEEYQPQKVVPIGIWPEDVPDTTEQFERPTLVFVGGLMEKQGIQLVIEAIPGIVEEIPEFNFLVMGSGPYENELKELVERYGVEEYVEFTGRVPDDVVYENLKKSHVGVAMYRKGGENFTYYTDPMKVKEYLSMGLPVLVTDVPYIAREIEERNAGKIVEYDVDSIRSSVVEILNNRERAEQYRRNAEEFSQEFTWQKVLDDALKLPEEGA
jgi:glycosyltransferase involved in cell wall biosynthesis